eukprot:2298005-Prymnesium_polylepis.1
MRLKKRTPTASRPRPSTDAHDDRSTGTVAGNVGCAASAIALLRCRAQLYWSATYWQSCEVRPRSRPVAGAAVRRLRGDGGGLRGGSGGEGRWDRYRARQVTRRVASPTRAAWSL